MNTPAYAARTSSSPLAPFTIERREPGANDVAIEILYCGVCHSDLHTARGEWPVPFPSVPGHEIIGRVTSTGERVARFKKGDVVGVGCMVDSCRVCRRRSSTGTLDPARRSASWASAASVTWESSSRTPWGPRW